MKQSVRKIIRYCRKTHIQVHRHYSSRGMFGKECVGFSGEDHDCAAIAVFISKKTGYDYCRDNMVFDMIYYFPNCRNNR